MKNFFLFLTLILSGHFLFGQQVYPVPADEAHWEIKGTDFTATPHTPYTRSYALVDGSDGYFNLINTSEVLDIHIRMRIKVDGQKVYFRKPADTIYSLPGLYYADNIDYLAFDFSLQEGDFYHYPDYSISSFTTYDSVQIEKIDTILFLDGSEHRRFKFHEPYQSICGEVNYWIEGTGAEILPFFFAHRCGETNITSYSYWEGSKKRYDNELVSTKKITQKPMEIYPNPSNGSFMLKNNVSELTLFNTMGKIVLRKQHLNAGETIHCQLPSGMYYVQMVANERLLLDKLVIE